MNLPQTMRSATNVVLFLFFLSLSNISFSQYDVKAYELLKADPAAFRTFLKENPGQPVNLKKADLRGMDLSQMDLTGADLSYCQLEGANFKESILVNVSFIGANIKMANFSRANLTNADFNKTNATGAIFLDAILKNTITVYLMIQDGHQLNPAYITDEGIVAPISK
jgi:uncharacterized protein YjbI with pentapeptide repeats